MRRLVVACDLGTSGCKSAIYETSGNRLAETYVAYATLHPAPLCREQAPEDWWRAILESCHAVIEQAAASPAEVLAIGLSGQSLALVPLDVDGRLLLESVPIWWDARAQEQAATFFREFPEDDWYMRTGNGFPAPLYTLFKLLWLRDHRPDVFGATRTVVGSKDFINYRLTGRVATDYSYASGFGAYDLLNRRYDRELLAVAGVDPALLPEIVPGSEVVGGVLPKIAKALGVAAGTPVVAGGVDNACMALGAREIRAGRVYCALGSSNWITVSSERPILDIATRPYVFDHVVPHLYVSAASTFGGGASISWIRERIFSEPGVRSVSNKEIETLAASAPVGAHELVCVPTLAGGTFLEGGPEVRGALVGLDLRHSRADVARAFLEGAAMALRPAVDLMRRLADIEDEMLLVGGGSKSAVWRQILADVFGMPVVRTNVDQQAATLGAAALACVGIGAWRDYSTIDECHKEVDREEPDAAHAERYRRLYAVFAAAAAQQKELAPALAELRGTKAEGD